MQNLINVTNFLDEFLIAPKGHTPADIRKKIEHWLQVANCPEQFASNGTNAYEVSYKRRLARQNLRRLIKKYPAIANQIREERATNGQRESV